MTVEVRCVNHRFADLRLRLPAALAGKEAELRRRVLDRVRRGRIELSVDLTGSATAGVGGMLHRALLDEVVATARLLQEKYGLEGTLDLRTALSVPGLFRGDVSQVEWGDELAAALDGLIGEALDLLEVERRREGRHLQQELVERAERMLTLLESLEPLARALAPELRARLLTRLRELAAEVRLDPGRVEQEAALLAERADVTEELVRLRGHLEQTRALLTQPDGEPLGKRLDFLAQEIHRETNTINSKSGSLELNRLALALKAETEKLREQIQNLE